MSTAFVGAFCGTRRYGLPGSMAAGFLGGAAVYTAANWLLSHRGAKHRKRSDAQQPSEAENSGSGLAIAVGALLDGIPESIVIGLSMLGGIARSSSTTCGRSASNAAIASSALPATLTRWPRFVRKELPSRW